MLLSPQRTTMTLWQRVPQSSGQLQEYITDLLFCFLSFQRLSFCAFLFIEADWLHVAALAWATSACSYAPLFPLPFAKRILTWNGGINAGTWNRSAPRLTSNGFKWTLLSRTATAKKNCAALVLLSIQSWSLGCTRQLRYFLSLFLEVFPFIWESVIRCGVSRFTRVALVSASGQFLFLSSQKRDAREKWKKEKESVNGGTAAVSVNQKTPWSFLHLHWQHWIWPSSYK